MEQLLSYAQENSNATSGGTGFWYIIMAIGLYKMMEKAGEPGWVGIVPFYNQYKLCEKVMGDPWYWLRLFVIVIPIVGWFMYFYFAYQMGKATAAAYGQPETWAWGYTFLAPVFYCITGFSSQYSYYGPFGMGDTRTGEARQARTVNFDVMDNPPPEAFNQGPKKAAAPSKEPEESSVEFDFHQDDIVE